MTVMYFLDQGSQLSNDQRSEKHHASSDNIRSRQVFQPCLPRHWAPGWKNKECRCCMSSAAVIRFIAFVVY